MRRPQVNVEGGLYRVYIRFARGAAVLAEADESERLLELVRGPRERRDLTVFAFCLRAHRFHVAALAGSAQHGVKKRFCWAWHAAAQ